eukprot:SAG31_NODE_3837_length_3834_cov_1.902276_1_plen_57_part_00
MEAAFEALLQALIAPEPDDARATWKLCAAAFVATALPEWAHSVVRLLPMQLMMQLP